MTSLTPHAGLKGHPASRSELSSPRVLEQALCASLFWAPTKASLATKIHSLSHKSHESQVHPLWCHLFH